MVRFPLLALALIAGPACADEITGKVLAFDRVDHIIVLEDKSIVTVQNPEVIPTDLMAGDTIKIDFKSEGDNGYGKIFSIQKQ